LPLYHIFSLTANCWLFASLGGTGLLIANPRDFPAFIKDLKRHPPMFFMGVNTLFNALMHTPAVSQHRFLAPGRDGGRWHGAAKRCRRRMEAADGLQDLSGLGIDRSLAGGLRQQDHR
jgi:long-chain acyl-CoA synthetase